MITRFLSLAAVLTVVPSSIATDDRSLLSVGPEHAAIRSVDPSVRSEHPVRVDIGLLSAVEVGTTFRVPLPDREAVTVSVDGVAMSALSGRTVRGRIDGQVNGRAAFVFNHGVVAGSIDLPGTGTWRIRPGQGGHVLLRVDPARLAGCGGTPAAADLLPPPLAAGGAICEDGSRVDVLILYTPVARVDAGGQAAVENEINLAVIAANEAYANSQIGFQIRVVGLQEIDYPENGNYTAHLSRLTDGSDGIMDEAHALRDELAADLVALIVADGENCGQAWLMPANSTSSEDRGFSVTTWYCAAAHVLAHELGHNMGACHAPGDGGGCSGGGLFEYSVGYRYLGDSGTQWRTVMAYFPGSRIPHFSNPGILFDGEPTGLDEADNGRTLNETSLAIANYRRPSCPGNARDDCVVDFSDILKILGNWGAPGGPSDVNEDGVVDFVDILFVLQHWGPCSYD